MKILFPAFLLMLFSHALYAQSNYEILKDKQSGRKVYKGVFSFEDLHAESNFGWIKRNYDSYKPDSAVVKYLKKNLPSYTIITFIGTWCEDTHKILPKLEKVLTLSSFPMNQYTMFGVDREKKTKNIEGELYSIESVPTIIVFKGHQEIGRIVETLKKSIEDDLANIIKPYVDQKEAGDKTQH